ncbi:MAG: class I SAM-dependent methyltransferase [Victivallaceae bacterium]
MQDNYFDKIASNWDDVPERIEMAQHFVSAIKDIIPLDSDIQALDFGCGTGNVALGLSPLLKNITAIDSSPAMLNVLEKKLAEAGIKNIKPLLLELDEDCLQKESFDLVYTCMTLHHIADIERILRIFYNQLKPSGHMVLIDLEKEDGSFHDNNSTVAHHGFELGMLNDMFESIGFSDTYARTAYTRVKTLPSGIAREYPIFMLTGMKPTV